MKWWISCCPCDGISHLNYSVISSFMLIYVCNVIFTHSPVFIAWPKDWSYDYFERDNHHHHVMPLAQISLTLTHYSSLSSITFGRSSKLHPVSVQSCWRLVLASRPTLAHPCEGFQQSTSLMSSSLLLQQFPACLVHIVAALWDVATKICSLQLTAFLCNCHQAFSLYALSMSMWCIHILV